MVAAKSIGLINATWIRNVIALVISFIAAILLQQSLPVVIFSFPIVLFGILYAIQALTYSVFLRYVEITTSSILSSLIPLVFLPIDLYILHAYFLPRQIIGIAILIIGGIIFFAKRNIASISPTKRHISIFLGIILFNVITYGFEAYLFKDYFESGQLSTADFLVSVSTVAFVCLTLVFIGKLLHSRKRFSLQQHAAYIKGSITAKLADYGNSFFFLQTLTLTSVTQTASMNVFYPVILLGVAILFQHGFKVKLEEYFDRKSLVQKICGIILICFGAFFAR